mmetsp:Transcript_55145/g.117652  ORF Transcript_55145/g.117652 Transcript_55145/m.117652 type:complete len:521 (+) Transcript_55145:109-1671(+)|eukprot:CAMPEP_0206451236 /NCGR_PEP_ID=MMETSP0324_2-20121206/19213_1 /ASSEMBLY_ACC=CAM_ASM_000836 /TAXON_ID=2866 /ORGANISM="Crypthecodinium cohnii, Strain Seligo" /LENGTH=520 /DNA_ID=CAMNT_0053921063 /DNA_START=106 /DNA_END=1668 /DNA_ORIENTATION=+
MGVSTDEGPQTPFAKLYYSDEMIRKYQPLVTALELMAETEGKDEEVRRDYEKHLKIYRGFEWCSNWDGKKYDLVFYGVSGYTGYLMMEYLKRVALKKTKEKFTFAFAGRTPSKVQEMRDREFGGTEWEDTPVLQMSYDDIYSIVDLVKSAKVIINVAGPYMLTQGDVMIDACIHMGVHYCDISGEVPWSLRVLDLHEYARDAGVHVIPSAASAGGYPDLGVYMIAKEAREKYGEEIRKAICYQSGGGAAQSASGGTLATRAAMSGAGDEVRKKMADPFSMGGFIPDRDRWGVKYCNIEFGTGKVTHQVRGEDRDANMSKITEDKKLGIWRGPFVYSYFDTRIVRRSNMLLADLGDRPYGRNLNFMEYAMIPPEVMMGMQQGGGGGGGESGGGGSKPGGVGVEAERAALEAQGRYYKQGEGPALEDLDDAWAGYFLYAETESGREMRANFIGRDGYFETARVAVEMALVLVFDFEKLPFKGGVLTPTVSGGECLVKRIVDSGMKFKLGAWFPPSEHCPPPY